MPVVPQVNIRNGSIVNPPAALEYGQPFQWANPVVGVNVGLSGCSGFATQDSYGVPGAPTVGTWGLKDAVMSASATSWDFTGEPEPVERAPGRPHITNPPAPAEERVA